MAGTRAIDDAGLERRLFPTLPSSPTSRPLPDWSEVARIASWWRSSWAAMDIGLRDTERSGAPQPLSRRVACRDHTSRQRRGKPLNPSQLHGTVVQLFNTHVDVVTGIEAVTVQVTMDVDDPSRNRTQREMRQPQRRRSGNVRETNHGGTS